mmetsp:Transcript_18964/g.44450  ORF Transcript_18964/g.44450 Transcript_18964/m.44450 type:complete len:218 (+) Transcript_18964:308-961(+)
MIITGVAGLRRSKWIGLGISRNKNKNMSPGGESNRRRGLVRLTHTQLMRRPAPSLVLGFKFHRRLKVLKPTCRIALSVYCQCDLQPKLPSLKALGALSSHCQRRVRIRRTAFHAPGNSISINIGTCFQAQSFQLFQSLKRCLCGHGAGSKWTTRQCQQCRITRNRDPSTFLAHRICARWGQSPLKQNAIGTTTLHIQEGAEERRNGNTTTPKRQSKS